MSITIARERPNTPDAVLLITELEAILNSVYPPESCHGFSVEQLIAEEVAFFLVRQKGMAVGCGGIKLIDGEYGEIKRLYVRPQFRGCGYAKSILNHLAEYALSHNISLLRLETGIYQPEAIALYERMGYYLIPPFGSYTDDPLSLCYEKSLA